tara:strand:+ start:321 stop:503 length:183 start_codon:yes stop_codon:yes gene_type:complete
MRVKYDDKGGFTVVSGGRNQEDNGRYYQSQEAFEKSEKAAKKAARQAHADRAERWAAMGR